MTANRDLKALIRSRMLRTGEAYTTARMHLLADQNTTRVDALPPGPVDTIVLKTGGRTARVRLGTEAVTFRSPSACELVPGQVATLRIARRWRYRDFECATGSVASARVDIDALGLEPLPLEDQMTMDPAEHYEGFTASDPVFELWQRASGRQRPGFVFDAIAWMGRAAAESDDPDECPVGHAAELMAAGEVDDARQILMELLSDDLRCLDAHAHLGILALDRQPERAFLHFEIGMRIGELSLRGRSEDLLLVWGHIYNRPYLRCLHGYASGLWRLGRFGEAERMFERMLMLNPNDNQGARFCWQAVREGVAWSDFELSEA